MPCAQERLPSDNAGMEDVPYRGVPFPPPSVSVAERPGGTLVLRSPHRFEPAPVRTVSEWLPRWSRNRIAIRRRTILP